MGIRIRSLPNILHDTVMHWIGMDVNTLPGSCSCFQEAKFTLYSFDLIRQYNLAINLRLQIRCILFLRTEELIHKFLAK